MARRVRGLLAEHRVTGFELARRTGWSQAYVSRRIRGKVAWRADDLPVIAEALGIDAADLLPERAA